MIGDILGAFFQYLIEKLFGKLFGFIGAVARWAFSFGNLTFAEASQKEKNGWLGFAIVLGLGLIIFYANRN